MSKRKGTGSGCGKGKAARAGGGVVGPSWGPRKTMDSLPDDDINTVFSFLPVNDVVEAMIVCRDWAVGRGRGEWVPRSNCLVQFQSNFVKAARDHQLIQIRALMKIPEICREHGDDVRCVREVLDQAEARSRGGVRIRGGGGGEDINAGSTPPIACTYPWMIKVDGAVDGTGATTMLNSAAQLSCSKVCEYLVEERLADVNVPDQQGFTRLMGAAYRGDTVLAKFLLGNDASRSATGYIDGVLHNSELTAAGWACRMDHHDTADTIDRLQWRPHRADSSSSWTSSGHGGMMAVEAPPGPVSNRTRSRCAAAGNRAAQEHRRRGRRPHPYAR